jgi:hypothetical protein
LPRLAEEGDASLHGVHHPTSTTIAFDRPASRMVGGRTTRSIVYSVGRAGGANRLQGGGVDALQALNPDVDVDRVRDVPRAHEPNKPTRYAGSFVTRFTMAATSGTTDRTSTSPAALCISAEGRTEAPRNPAPGILPVVTMAPAGSSEWFER